ncbi:hypothetical protein JKI95_10255 [Corynebacterium aquatimens]|uniref:hypothetical protein n=1 Tax=Corynebacterium aquatimens TaxID=1190508 RepID=UPI002541031B|nr:hypothetical protein [Corynebacterium aquatimens]QYH19453.1 hypothetical protein JKI95_10255 [Corynebacterium aquatimens]
MLASIRRHLITDVQTSAGDTGVLMRGTIAGDLETQLPELSGHISRLLEQNCIDALTLKTADNLRLSFYGFCFSTIPETTISQLATLADEQDAEAMIIMDTHSSSAIEAEVVWLDVPDARLNSLELVWRDQIRPAGIKRLRFAAYGETEAAFYENPEASRTRLWRDPTGDTVPRAVTKSA